MKERDEGEPESQKILKGRGGERKRSKDNVGGEKKKRKGKE